MTTPQYDFQVSNFFASDSLSVGALKYPAVDGTKGSLLVSDGAGNLSLDEVKMLEYPSSAPDTSIVIFDGPSGSKIKSSEAFVDPTGKLFTKGLSVGSLEYPSTDGGLVQSVLESDGQGKLSFVVKNSLYGKLLKPSLFTTPGDHIPFDNVDLSLGKISLDVQSPYSTKPAVDSIGRILVPKTRSYFVLDCLIENLVFKAHNSYFEACWWDVDLDLAIGSPVKIQGIGDKQPGYCVSHFRSFLPPGEKRVELRITAASGLVQLVSASFEAKEI